MTCWARPLALPIIASHLYSKGLRKCKRFSTSLETSRIRKRRPLFLDLVLPFLKWLLPYVRTSPPGHIRQATAAFDNAMLEALSNLAGGPLLEWTWLKASLPSSLGGLNIRRVSLHASAAYISSLDQSKELVA